MVPVLACGPGISQVTPTPTKTPRRARTVVSLPTVTPTPLSTPTPEIPPTDTPMPTPVPTDTPIPVPPTDTSTPEPPTPTNTPLPPPPPTNTPVPAQPTSPPPPPTSPPPSSKPEVIVELPEGDVFNTGEEVKIIFIVRDPDGVDNFTWGIFLQNLTPLVGGDKSCGGATECRVEVEEKAPISGTYIVGADAVDVHGNTARGTSAIYVP